MLTIRGFAIGFASLLVLIAQPLSADSMSEMQAEDDKHERAIRTIEFHERQEDKAEQQRRSAGEQIDVIEGSFNQTIDDTIEGLVLSVSDDGTMKVSGIGDLSGKTLYVQEYALLQKDVQLLRAFTLGRIIRCNVAYRSNSHIGANCLVYTGISHKNGRPLSSDDHHADSELFIINRSIVELGHELGCDEMDLQEIRSLTDERRSLYLGRCERFEEYFRR